MTAEADATGGGFFDAGATFPGAQEIPGVDAFVDVCAGADVVTPVMFWALPGVALEFSPPAGRSASDVCRHVRNSGVHVGRFFPIMQNGADTWLIKVPEAEAAKAEGVIRRMK